MEVADFLPTPSTSLKSDVLRATVYTCNYAAFMYFIGPAPAIPHDSIKPYQWGTEYLSGDVAAGPATSFPQAIGIVSMVS